MQRSSQYDVAIVGGGFAGLAALQQAQERGLTCCLIADKTAATQHFSGAFDLVDPRWADRQAGITQPVQLSAELEKFIRAHPQHFYAACAKQDKDFSEKLPRMMKSFLKFYHIAHEGDGEQNAVVFAATGAPKPTAYASAGLSLTPQEIVTNPSVAFLHVASLPDYPVNLISANLKKIFRDVSVVSFQGAANLFSPLAFLLQEFENEVRVDKLIAELRGNLGQASILFLPPILGVMNAEQNRRKLTTALGVRVVELLSVLPSTAGLRFKACVEQYLTQHKMTRILGCVTGFTSADKRIQSVTVQQSGNHAEEIVVNANQFILATGKFIGGGIRHQECFAESVFHLPLYCGDTAVSEQSHVSSFLSQRAQDTQAFLSLGVAVDTVGRPCADNRVVWQNLKACGHVLTGFDFTRERCGFGVSVASALRCF